MSLNPYFLQGSKSEQSLVQSLVNEQLKIYGIEIYYLPRKYVNQTTVIREVIESEFNTALPIEAYVDNYEGYGGQGTVLSKFGIQEQDDLTLIISRDRWETYIQPLIKNLGMFSKKMKTISREFNTYLNNISKEKIKLKILNSSHSALAYIGLLLGYKYVHEVINNKNCYNFINNYLEKEVIPTIQTEDDFNLNQYKNSFKNYF